GWTGYVGKKKHAVDRIGRRRVRVFVVRITRVVVGFDLLPVGDDLIAERMFRGRIEAAIRAIEPFLPRYLYFITQTQIQIDALIDAPVVLDVTGVVGSGEITRISMGHAPRCRQT